MKNITLQVNQEQMGVITDALDLYIRIGLGQFDRIADHPTVRTFMEKKEFDDQAHILSLMTLVRNEMLDTPQRDARASFGIHNENVHESCRVAFDISQVIRHEFWKQDENRLQLSTSAHVNLLSEKGDEVSCVIG